MRTSPSTQEEPLQLSSSEDELQQWVDEQSEEGNDILKMSNFVFMLMGIELVEDKIRDTPTGELQQEDQMQLLPNSQGPNLTPPSLPLVTVVDKGSITPPPQSLEEEHVQEEPSQGEEP